MLIDEKIEFNGKISENRALIQPMEGCDGNPDGGIGELTRRRYLRFCESGAGVIWFEATAVCEEGRANPRQLWLTKENAQEYADLLAEMRAESRKKFGFEPIIILQATHSGRYAKPNGEPRPIVAYRREAFERGKEDLPYRVLTDAECDGIIENFAKTAELAAKTGFDGVDVKCCHGYLFNEFLSAYDREGKYGGSLENRTALYFACIDAVKNNISDDMFVTTRLNVYDGFAYPDGFGADADNGVDLTEPKKIIGKLKENGVELVNITIGNPYLIPSVNRPFVGGTEDGRIGVERMERVTGELQREFPELKFVQSALTFMGTDAIAYAERCLKSGACSLVGFGRMAFAYPDFYADYKQNGALNADKVCLKCGNCSKMMRAGGVAGCPVRDKEVYLPEFRKCAGKI